MDADETHLQLYTLEYQKAAERYDNIYRSIWTIFSYLTAVAAGFLAFGSDRIEPHALICVAAAPLLFWFWTTYMPLDRYGNQVVNRLGEIEGLLNTDFNTKLNHFTRAAHPLSVCEGLKRRGGLREQSKRARFAIGLVFIFLHLFVVYEAYLFCNSGKPFFREKPTAATPLARSQ